jgi:hypothetical protein
LCKPDQSPNGEHAFTRFAWLVGFASSTSDSTQFKHSIKRNAPQHSTYSSILALFDLLID